MRPLLAFLTLLFYSFSSYAQLPSSAALAKVVSYEEVHLPLTPDTHQVLYSEQVLVKGQSQMVLRGRSKRWLCTYLQLPSQGKTWEKQEAMSSPGEQVYQLQVQGLSIPYTLHYLVTLHPDAGSYRYTISNFTIELPPDPEHPKPAFFPLEKYLEAIFVPRSNEEQMVAQFQQHVQACANQIAASLKQVMRNATTSGSPSVTLQR
jgi:hypothetical protein